MKHKSRIISNTIVILLVLTIGYTSTNWVSAETSELFISEYVEGSSSNRAIEIYNGTSSSISLTGDGYVLEFYFNGSPSPGVTIPLTGVVSSGDVFVLADADADALILAQTDQTSTENFFTGNDAVILRKNGVVIDAIGQIGYNPGSEWGSGLISTKDSTLRRQATICEGDEDASDAFYPAQEWDGYAEDTFDGLGAHYADCGPIIPDVWINEVDADQLSTDSAEFVELYDGGDGNKALDGLVLVFFNGSDDSTYQAFDLDGYSTGADGYFVLCANAATVPNCDLDVLPDTNLIQNGADAVALYAADGGDFQPGTPVTTTDLVDAIVYDTNDADDAGLLVLLNAGQPQVNEGGKGNSIGHSNQRCPNGSGGNRNTSTYDQYAPTAGAENVCPPPPVFGVCGDPATLIHDIQGTGTISLRTGETHVIEGVVVGDFQDTSTELSGFFLQEEDADADTEPTTSEGIFVYDNGLGIDVSPGDVVRAMGEVVEYYDMTELTSVTDVAVCSSGSSVTPAGVALPIASLADWEMYEGMLITVNQTLYVTDNYNLGRFGEVHLSVGDRLDSPTNVVSPGAPALALQDLNDRSRILVDDGSTVENPLPLPPYLAPDNTLRAGDTTPGLLGVLSYSYSSYRVHPTALLEFTRQNDRHPPPAKPEGMIDIASFNVLNYFTTLDNAGDICGPSGDMECRGADTPEEFIRQRDKIISALAYMNSDVVGIMEIENNATTAIQNLIDGLNDVLGSGTYNYVDTGVIGTDAIKVALIYKPANVTPVGAYAILDSSVDPTFLDTKNRPTLAQTFDDSLGGRFTVAVNHFKSKGSPCDDVSDPDTGDGQGNCNLTRTSAATALANWLATDPTGSGDPDYLIIGDLNAYAKEDPVVALQDAGYTDLINEYAYPGSGDYSFTYMGQSGYLDHALANSSLESQITFYSAIWHINADEPNALNYNDYNQPDLYNPDQYRSSDHDPVIVYLDLDPFLTIYLPIIAR
jgi:predicted extracellular nuclease